MRVQGYIEIDYQAMTENQSKEFNQLMYQYNMYYYRVHKDNREYYFCILNDSETIPVLLELLSSRNPIINGLWDIEGTPYGKIKEVNEDTGEVTITGDAEYDFDLAIHLTHTPTDKVYDDESNIISETPVTEFKPLHGFAGWALCQEY